MKIKIGRLSVLSDITCRILFFFSLPLLLCASSLTNGLAQDPQPAKQLAATNIFSGIEIESPTNFIFSISNTDYIIVTNTFRDEAPLPNKSNYNHLLSGAEAKKLIEALSKLNRDRYTYSPAGIGALGLKLYFFHGTNCIAMANFENDFINCEDGDFQDHTKTLSKLYKQFADYCQKGAEEYSDYMFKKLAATNAPARK